MSHKIIVTINPDGTTKIKVDGATGTSCKDATKALEAALGQTVKDEKTADYYKTKTTIQQKTNNG